MARHIKTGDTVMVITGADKGKTPPAVCTVKGSAGAAQEGDRVGEEGADAEVATAAPTKGKGKVTKGGGKKKPGKKGKKKK